MAQRQEHFSCTVNHNDQLVTYITDIEHPPHDEFVMVMTNADDQKISVVLSVEDGLRLREQLDTFIINSTIRR